MYELKTLHAEAIPRALALAERYRLLNDPWEAESICRDILGTEPGNQQALVTLLLSLTDQFGNRGVGQSEARSLLARIADDYHRTYFSGVISERWAKACLREHQPGELVHGWFADALHHYEQAARLSPKGNEDAVLRWNACVRQLDAHPHLRPHFDDDDMGHSFGDSSPSPSL